MAYWISAVHWGWRLAWNYFSRLFYKLSRKNWHLSFLVFPNKWFIVKYRALMMKNKDSVWEIEQNYLCAKQVCQQWTEGNQTHPDLTGEKDWEPTSRDAQSCIIAVPAWIWVACPGCLLILPWHQRSIFPGKLWTNSWYWIESTHRTWLKREFNPSSNV